MQSTAVITLEAAALVVSGRPTGTEVGPSPFPTETRCVQGCLIQSLETPERLGRGGEQEPVGAEEEF